MTGATYLACRIKSCGSNRTKRFREKSWSGIPATVVACAKELTPRPGQPQFFFGLPKICILFRVPFAYFSGTPK
eukprot:4067324-Karenia_brevis.AAC.1